MSLCYFFNLACNGNSCYPFFPCRPRQMWGKLFTNSHSTLTVYLLQKMTCLLLNNLFMVMFQPISMCSYAKNKLLLCSVTQHTHTQHTHSHTQAHTYSIYLKLGKPKTTTMHNTHTHTHTRTTHTHAQHTHNTHTQHTHTTHTLTHISTHLQYLPQTW